MNSRDQLVYNLARLGCELLVSVILLVGGYYLVLTDAAGRFDSGLNIVVGALLVYWFGVGFSQLRARSERQAERQTN